MHALKVCGALMDAFCAGMGPTFGYTPSAPFGIVKSIGVSDSPPRMYVVSCGRRVVFVSAVTSFALATSSALICTFRFSFNACATASLRVRTCPLERSVAKKSNQARFISFLSKPLASQFDFEALADVVIDVKGAMILADRVNFGAFQSSARLRHGAIAAFFIGHFDFGANAR